MRNHPILRPLMGAGLLSLCAAVHALAAPPSDPNNCGDLRNHYGPYDYRTQQDKLAIVEAHHFTPRVENLQEGQEGYLAGDLYYTLHTFPNHHRALIAVMRLADRVKDQPPKGMNLPMECYFDRAIRFAPDDPLVRIIYAQYLVKRARTTEALAQLDAGAEYAKDNAFTHYNLGLAYFELNAFDKAREQAQIARDQGFERMTLIDKLKSIKQWPDDPAAPASQPASSASAASSP